ncbi:TNT domain-containing protein [Nocardioides sp. Iso805N]|uniref:TNT domain-containing protein n=1 Tax=Nocardioides sp. Iso805N TaxID=1283287 RepID=UPI00035D85DC|nr:TNT domain-containing protein [Nocardioides sp. Iso805N]
MTAGRQEAFGDRLRASGVPLTSAILTDPPTPGTPPPPEGVWAVVPYGDGFVVGAVARGRFATYGTAADLDGAAVIVSRLVLTRPRTLPTAQVDALERRGEVTAEGIRQRTSAREGAAGPAAVAAGEALDTFGAETTHHLYALGTPFAERSQPPTDVDAPYHRYLVLSPLPEAQEGLAAPWFAQPGSGAMVVLGRPIRWYIDQGHLVEVVD